MDLLIDLLLEFGDEASQIAILNVHADDNAALPHTAINQCRTFNYLRIHLWS
jgi:hypothetical protein